jgi:UDP-N-acetylglucosamine/UDP-N-acetylgalactosamine diphosphorylase
MQSPTFDSQTTKETHDTLATRTHQGATTEERKMTSPQDFQKLKQLFTSAGQGQVFRFEEKLSEEERSAFYEQLQSIDVEGLAKKYAAAVNPSTSLPLHKSD